MSNNYNIQNIRTLLTKGFTDTELRSLCHDTPEFESAYHQLSSSSSKVEIIDALLEYAEQKCLVELLLTSVKERNPTRYERHKPYTSTDRGLALSFVNRERELESLLQSLTNPAGDHFWLVSAPPQLGKTWFLDELVKQLSERENHHWEVRRIDLRAQMPGTRSDPIELITMLFGLPPNARLNENAINRIVAEISRSGKCQLCLVDSAELLRRPVATDLRAYLCQIYDQLGDVGRADIRLAFIAASRRLHQAWKGISPPPRFAHLTLTHFTPNVVSRALHDKADQAERQFNPRWYQENTERFYKLTEGLPALLVKYIEGLEQIGFSKPQQLESRSVFKELAEPYVCTVLLSTANLLPLQEEAVRAKRDILEQFLLRLSAYRLFTQSHLAHIAKTDPKLETALSRLNLTIDQLWQMIGETYLMQPVDEPWRVLYPAIRSLLFRYHYTTTRAKIEAHRQAGEFYKDWWNGMPAGKEQSMLFIQRLWHSTEQLRLARASNTSGQIIQFAGELCQQLSPPHKLVLKELVIYIRNQMREDEELQRTLNSVDKNLFSSLIETVEKRGGISS